MKSRFFLGMAAGWFLAATSWLPAAEAGSPLIYETEREFFGTGDFDGDGRLDVVIVDKESGKYRPGYQQTNGVFSWVDCRPSGSKDVAGFTIGKLLATNRDALVFASTDANQITVVDASSATASSKPVNMPFTAALGPNTLAALDIGGENNTPLADLFVGSTLNAPDPSLAVLLRNDGKEFPKLAEEILSGVARRANRVAIKPGQADFACELVTGEKGDTLRLENFATGQPVLAASAEGLPSGADYAAGAFGGSSLAQFLIYKPGEKALVIRPVSEPAPGRFEFGKGDTFDLSDPIKRVITLPHASGAKLFVIFGEGEKAGVFTFDGTKAPVLTQTIVSTNEMLSYAAGYADGLVVFSHPAGGKFSTRYQSYKTGQTGFEFVAFGGLASLADNDNITIPDIYERIVNQPDITEESKMAVYTNSIPGTAVKYVMVPIHGGEFVMGSPANEAGRKPDEGPQHTVKISPFWMERCEVTWNEYELFMYPDEEKRARANLQIKGDEGDTLADAVTHPSKPYVEMSFGMGKDGFPAISMTQHAANKYCQWLSARTGQFYRLPTEAEWEYACRAGTKTAHFFGDDISKLGEYAWYEQNSDFKYQKVGKKKPNPWGLHDMYGNVVEWVLDQYDAQFYQKSTAQGVASDPWNRATKPYPLAARGGSWDDDPTRCRSAARRGSERAWKMQDPQLPKSVWYFSDAQFVGFRIVRPLKVPTQAEMQNYWTSGVERD